MGLTNDKMAKSGVKADSVYFYHHTLWCPVMDCLPCPVFLAYAEGKFLISDVKPPEDFIDVWSINPWRETDLLAS